MRKRLASLILAICMILPMIPITPAFGQGGVYEYNLATRASGTGWASFIGLDYADTDGNWAYYAKSTATTWARDPSGNSCQQFLNAHMRIWQDKIGQWVALKIRIPEAGTYSMDLYYRQTNSTSAQLSTGVYMLPASVTGAQLVDGMLPEANQNTIDNIENALKNSAGALVNYSAYNAAASANGVDAASPLYMGELTIAAPGEYLLIIRHEEIANNDRYTLVRKLVLKKASAPLNSISLTIPDKLSAEQTAQAQLTGSLADASEADFTGAAIAYESSDEAVATVTNTGLITAVGAGQATISVTVNLRGVSKVASAVIEVTEPDPEAELESVTITLPEQLTQGQTAQAQVNGMMSDGTTADMSQAVISYSSGNTSVTTVNGTGLVIAAGAGSTTISVSVTLGGKTCEAFTSIDVLPAGGMALSGVRVEYDLVQRLSTWTAHPDVLAVNPAAGNDCIVKIPYEFTGSETRDGNWAYYAKDSSTWTHESSTSNLTLSQYVGARLRIWPNANGQWVAFKIKVPAAGRYAVKLFYTEIRNTTGQLPTDVHLIPGSVAGAELVDGMLPEADSNAVDNINTAILSNNYRKGTFDSYYRDASAASNAYNYPEDPIDLQTIDVSAPGEYILAFRHAGSGARYAMVRKLVLDGRVLDKATINLSKAQLLAGDEADLCVVGSMQNGESEVLRPASAEIVWQSSNPSAVEISADGTRITARAVGDADISVMVRLGNIIKTDMVSITVSEPAERSHSIENYDFTTKYITGTGVELRGVKYSETGVPGNWEYYGHDLGWSGEADAISMVKETLSTELHANPASSERWAAFKIKVPNSGLYTAKLRYCVRENGAISNVYIIPISAAGTKTVKELVSSDKYKIGEVNFLKSDASSSVEASGAAIFGDVNLIESGEYILVFRQKATSTQNYSLIREFILDGNVLGSVVLQSDKNAISLGESARLQVSGVSTNHASMKVSPQEIIYASENSDIASVTQDGTITAVSAGQARIAANVTINGVTSSASIDITVKDEEYTAAQLSGIKEVYTLDYRRPAWRPLYSTLNNDIRGMTYNFTPEAGAPSYVDGNWEYHSADPNWEIAPTSIYQYIGLYLRLNAISVGNWAAMKIRISEAGRYTAALTYRQQSGAGASDIYLMPVSVPSVESGILGDYYCLGQVNYRNSAHSSAVTAPDETAVLRDVEIPEAGEYLLVFRQANVANGAYLFPKNFILNGKGPLDSFALNIARTGLIAGDTIETEAVITWNEEWDADTSNVVITYTSSDPESVSVSDTGVITALKNGFSIVSAAAEIDGYRVESKEITIVVGQSKTARSYYTDEKVANARNNIAEYAWAKSIKNSVTKQADVYVERGAEYMWNLMTTQDLPRSLYVGLNNDPERYFCPYCKKDLLPDHGQYPFDTSALSSPWKVRCPDCRRQFPSNDFGSFYKLGINENGKFNLALAHDNNNKIIADGGDGYLVNRLYPEMGEGWGVDDGYGYKSGKMVGNVQEVKTFIGYYNFHGLWTFGGVIKDALNVLGEAYLYTGEEKYGNLGAIMLDRAADLYPEFDTMYLHKLGYRLVYASYGTGKIAGYITDSSDSSTYTLGYDAFYPAMENQKVISFLSEKAARYNMNNPKTSASLIRLNSENGILRETFNSVKREQIAGNFGMYQEALAYTAIVLDTMPETKEILDFCMQTGDVYLGDRITGGNINKVLLSRVDRDGHGNESGPGYNRGWIGNLSGFANAINEYGKYDAVDLYNHPRFIRMRTAQMDLTACSRFTPTIGDSGAMGRAQLIGMYGNAYPTYFIDRDPDLATWIYLNNGNKATVVSKMNLFDSNPERLDRDLKEVSDKNAMLELGSRNLAGYGFAILRGGKYIKDSTAHRTLDTQRDFWIYYGRTAGHGHPDKLNLGIHAYGLDFAPDFGYPEAQKTGALATQFQYSTISHNTILVNDKPQKGGENATPLHFDDSGIVKLMDISAPTTYDEASIYRRTLVMVDASDEVSYGVDFFRVRGGKDHLYSFHALSDTITDIDGLEMVKQADSTGKYAGSYAGKDVPWGASSDISIPTGYQWMRNVDRARDPGTGAFSVNFKITDFLNVLPQKHDFNLRFTMLNDFNLSEVAIADGIPPRQNNNPESLRFLLARRSGRNLDSLFTSVIEPYKGERYVESLESVPVAVVSGNEGIVDEVKAVKVRLANGREDYIVYATNNSVTYNVDGEFNFRGFVGVYSLKDGKNVYSYINDGDIIGETTGLDTVATGQVVDFSKDITIENYITISTDQQIEPEKLNGKYIYIDNGNDDTNDINGCYEIETASSIGNNIRLELGYVSLITDFKNLEDDTDGYTYNIAEGQTFRIPFSILVNPAPVFTPVSSKSVDANSEIRFSVSATSPLGAEATANLIYKADSLPRGAAFDEQARTFSWRPDNGQIGANRATLVVSDGLRDTTMHISIQVNTATAGAKPQRPDDSGSNGGTDAGNGVAPPPPSTVTGTFTDLGGFDWAQTAINSLAARDIIKGTGANTYSPGANIKRADFAILLVRAFNLGDKLDEVPEDSFADVPKNAYYASEIAVAKALGIITGTGENAFNPLGEISREDMMLIVYRTLKLNGNDLTADTESLGSFADKGKISEYATEAVAALTKAGIVQGSAGRINPKGKATRAEIAMLLYRILNG